VLANDIAPDRSHVDIHFTLPQGPIAIGAFEPLGDRVTPVQRGHIHVGVDALRRAFSSQILTHFVLRRVRADIVARTDIGSEADMLRLKEGGALVSLVAEPGLKGEGSVGRPVDKAIDETLKNAFGEAVARVLRVGAVSGSDEEDRLFDAKLDEVGERLETKASLFNLNADHLRYHAFPVRNWCETNGPDLLATAYGMEPNACETALDAVLRRRIRQRGYETVLAEEIDRIDTLLAWTSAYDERRSGLSRRRDTLRRTLNSADVDWEDAPGRVEPPRIYGKVRRAMVAEQAQGILSTRSMLESAFLFDLQAALDVFLTRLYLMPILAAAGFAGRLGLRRQPGAIASTILAGGLLALAENRQVAMAGVPDVDDEEDDIFQFQELIRTVLARSDLNTDQLAVAAYGHFQTGQPVVVEPPAGQPSFFLFD
jgi:hypothetical protein